MSTLPAYTPSLYALMQAHDVSYTPTLVCTMKGQILTLNHCASELLGYPPNEIPELNQLMPAYSHDEGSGLYQGLPVPQVDGQHMGTFKGVHVKTRGGNEVDLDIAVVFKKINGEGVYLNTLKLSEDSKLEQKAQDLLQMVLVLENDLKKEKLSLETCIKFVFGAFHDIKNLQVSEILQIELIRKGLLDHIKEHPLLQSIYEECNTLRAIQLGGISSLISNAEWEIYNEHLGNGSQYSSLLEQHFSLPRLIHNIETLHKPACTGKNIRLNVLYSSLPELVIGDYPKTLRIFNNIIGNAIKFSPQDSTITFEIFAGEEVDNRYEILFVIKDQGEGIHPSILENDRFLESGICFGEKKGSGLGLAIANALTRMMGGVLAAHNASDDGEEGGAVFMVRIPYKKSQRPLQLSLDTLNPLNKISLEGHEGLRLLFIDDSEAFRKIMQATFEKFEVYDNVDVAKEGIEGVKKFKQAHEEGKPYDIIFLDLHMTLGEGNEGDGDIAAKNIRELEKQLGYRHTPLILLSGARPSPDCPVDEVLEKPILVPNLIHMIDEHVVEKRRRAEESAGSESDS